MKKIHWLITVCLLGAGLLISFFSFAAMNFRFDALFGKQGKTVTHTVSEPFTNISIDVDTTDITLYPSEDGTCKVVVTENERLFHTVSVQNDTLTISRTDLRRWYEQLFSTFSMKADLYLPLAQYNAFRCETDTGDLIVPGFFGFTAADAEVDTGDIFWSAPVSGKLSLSADTGDLTLQNFPAGALELETTTGNILLEGVRTGALEAEADTGDICLTETVAEQTVKIATDTGNVIFDRADGGSIFVETDTGNVRGTVQTEKLFRAESGTGRVSIPWDTRGSDCIVISDTGSIKLSVAP